MKMLRRQPGACCERSVAIYHERSVVVAVGGIVGVLLLMAIGSTGSAEEQMQGTGHIDYAGYVGCIKLENADTRVILGPHCGGRVLEYAWKRQNALYLNPEHDGWIYEPDKPTIDPSGGRFDIGPEQVIPRRPNLWLGEWSAEITGPRQARMTSVKDEATGVQLIREFTLDAATSHLTCTQTIKNISNETRQYCHWSRTFALGGGICLIPLTPNSRFPNQYIMYGPGPVMNYRPQDPNIRVRDNFLEILSTPQHPKLGMDAHAGWLAYLMQNGLMFVKRFPTYPSRVYNEMAGLTISIWYYKDIMCELEPIGPAETLAPGESASFTEDWWLTPYPFPAAGESVNLAEITGEVTMQTDFQTTVSKLKHAFPKHFLADATIAESNDINRPMAFGEPNPPEGFAGSDPTGQHAFGIYVPVDRGSYFEEDISMEQWIFHEMFHFHNRRHKDYDPFIDKAFPDDNDPLVQWLMKDPYHRTFAREEAFINLITFADPARTPFQKEAVREWFDYIGAEGKSLEEIQDVLNVIKH